MKCENCGVTEGVREVGIHTLCGLCEDYLNAGNFCGIMDRHNCQTGLEPSQADPCPRCRQ